MSHPCVVTLSQHSRPRVLLSGDRLVEVQLPAGTCCLYPTQAAIQSLLDDPTVDPALSLLARNEDDLSSREYASLRGWVVRGRSLRAPEQVQRLATMRGAVDETVSDVAQRAPSQFQVPVTGQSDVLVVATPVSSVLGPSNPLQMQGQLLGWLCASGAPLVKRGGTLIVTHPFTDAFDHKLHAAHYELVHRLLPKTRDTNELRQRHQAQFIGDPALLSMHVHGSAVHPARAFDDWCRGEPARRHLGRMIAVGADNEYIPQLLGFETAGSMAEALYRARGERSTVNVACVGLPELVHPVVRVPSSTEAAA